MRDTTLASLELREERVGGFFEADGRQRPVAGADDGVGGKREDRGAIGGESLGIGNHGVADRTGEQGVADDRDGVGEAGDDVGDPAAGMAAGRAGLDRQPADGKMAAGGEGLGGGLRFLGRGVNRDVRGAQVVERGDVVAVGMGEKDGAEVEPVAVEESAYRSGIETGIEGRCRAGRRFPDEISVDGHGACGGGDLGEAVDGEGWGLPPPMGDGEQGRGVEPEGGGDLGKRVIVDAAAESGADDGRRQAGPVSQLLFGQPETAARFAQDIGEIVFELHRVHSHPFATRGRERLRVAGTAGCGGRGSIHRRVADRVIELILEPCAPVFQFADLLIRGEIDLLFDAVDRIIHGVVLVEHLPEIDVASAKLADGVAVFRKLSRERMMEVHRCPGLILLSFSGCHPFSPIPARAQTQMCGLACGRCRAGCGGAGVGGCRCHSCGGGMANPSTLRRVARSIWSMRSVRSGSSLRIRA